MLLRGGGWVGRAVGNAGELVLGSAQVYPGLGQEQRYYERFMTLVKDSDENYVQEGPPHWGFAAGERDQAQHQTQ